LKNSDAEDVAAVAAARAEDAALAAQLELDRGSPVETTIPIEVVKAELDGAHPLAAWRDYRGWTQAELAAKSGVGQEVIAEIESRKQDGDIVPLNRIARALNVPIEALIEDDREGIGETR
jgi:DNA-binding XRE family transcriptional regulator